MARPTRDSDFAELGELADRIEPLVLELDGLYKRRRVVLARRVAAGDRKTDVAEAARITRVNLNSALRPHLVKPSAAERKAAAKARGLATTQ